MKTLTEFTAIGLKQALQTRNDLLQQGKTAEELPTALGEALKVEGDRLTHLLTALELVQSKITDLKRVLVFSLNEGEKSPSGTVLKGEPGKQVGFLSEYYPSLEKKGKERGTAGPDRNEKGRKGKGRNGDRNRRDKQGKTRRPERSFDGGKIAAPTEQTQAAGAELADRNSEGHGALRPRRPRKARPPREMEPAKKLEPLALDNPNRFVIAPRSTPLAAAPAAVENQKETQVDSSAGPKAE
ncbi:MAG: hypothetical protein HYX41_05565 [Bdellovibrio sp.]|nr:hypothetical protein [Bdellovibrio sp.]